MTGRYTRNNIAQTKRIVRGSWREARVIAENDKTIKEAMAKKAAENKTIGEAMAKKAAEKNTIKEVMARRKP